MSNRGISLVDAHRIVKEALNSARAKNLPSLAIALLDSGGHLKAFASEDDAALGMGFGSGQFIPLPGGVLIINQGQVVGALGVSGTSS